MCVFSHETGRLKHTQLVIVCVLAFHLKSWVGHETPSYVGNLSDSCSHAFRLMTWDWTGSSLYHC